MFVRSLVIALCLTATAAGAASIDEQDNWNCPGVSNIRTGKINPNWRGRDLTKAQCQREIKDMKAWVTAYWRKYPTGNVSQVTMSCVNYCLDLYPELR
jgi:hypothetical protein